MELLRELGPFHYMMNQGNVGDALIAASTVALFEREELNFSSCGPELPAGKEEITLVYGGGGGFVPYFGMLPHYVRLFSDPRLRKCVILPQSFRDCDASLVALPGAGKLAVCLRDDPESTGHAQALKELPLNTDLSVYSVRVIDEVEHAFAYTRWLLKALDQPDAILTDRLHLGISGALLGKEVFLMDNVYGKISGIYELSLRERFPRVHLLNELSEFPWLEKVLTVPDLDRCRERKAKHARQIGKAAALSKYLYYRKEENGVLRVKVCGLRICKKRVV